MKRIVYCIVVLIVIGAQVVCFAQDDNAMPETFFEERYLFDYPDDFFKTGGLQVPFNPRVHLKVGIVIKNKSRMMTQEIIEVIFSVGPFDRYRNFFVFLDSDLIERNRNRRDFFIDAYDGYGRRIPGGFDIGNTSVRAGLIVLRVDDYEFTRTGTLGYAQGKRAIAQRMTILHEFGHVFADLGDEYSIDFDKGNKEINCLLMAVGASHEHQKHLVWNTERVNLDYRSHSVLKWQPLIDKGFIPDTRVPRIQIQDNVDTGRFLIPMERCIENRMFEADMEFCPVCQLQIIESICRVSGIIPPWEREQKEEQ
ncbi:MAG: hypothetical protein KKH94_10110 [Candidatus Omnitrophica bacterium]|nr:hypothetical protein [Candidatus Omnitrophota bacterium]